MWGGGGGGGGGVGEGRMQPCKLRITYKRLNKTGSPIFVSFVGSLFPKTTF